MEKMIRIGWGKRSIAPDDPTPIPGQFNMRISLGSYTPILASALTIENGDDAVIFVSCDAVSVSPDVLKLAQEILIKEVPELPVEKIILNATHTHAGPGDRDISTYPNQIKVLSSEEVRAFLSRQIADAVKESWTKRAPGSVSYGYGFATTGHSRRVVYKDDYGLRGNKGNPGLAIHGHGVMYGNTNDPMFESYEAGSDSYINLLYTFDEAGKLTGAIINVPCPSQTNEHAWMFHASFWHNVREKLTAAYGEIGVIGQAAAAGDLSPRPLHYREAEKRRFYLKYRDKIEAYFKNPLKHPKEYTEEQERVQQEHDVIEMMRAEDIANRIIAAFEEVKSWAEQEKFSNPVLKHEVLVAELERRMFPKEMMEEEKKNLENLTKEGFITEGDEWDVLFHNSIQHSKRFRCGGVVARYELQEKQPTITSDIHVVRIGNIAFATNRFELYMDYQHRIQARSPFEQTFIVQLVTGPHGAGSYLATERGEANKGYSASPYCNQVSPNGGQQLVDETLKILEGMK